ncbi:serine hydrolase domain-containing protein [Porphyrobacter sp. CACIAM 03H1]|uniref:serine hydrolase domain-containing protein n=1 Tax=Porphyrobacter sp. CACIAM 03H1 TaxID=2003315 RepID=UPI000B5AABF3|nr:serine hydrolase [Porphyrobacter sp. CACIAM 03H1]ASJ91931.1 6-aminohexanoate hydrolase [Porphyrobacter sp. CACIAM 03H1]
MKRRAPVLLACASLGGLLLSGPVMAWQDKPSVDQPVATSSQARMNGFPPAADTVVSKANILRPENLRWAFRNLRQLYPTQTVRRPERASSLIVGKQRDLAKIEFVAAGEETLSLAEWQKRTHTDALVVLHKGRIVYQQYDPGMTGRTPHALWSMSKSIVGLLAMKAIEDGRLDRGKQITAYLPELQGSGWEGATLQDALDMRVGIAYRESFSDPKADVFRYLFAAGLLAPPKDLPVARNMYDYLATISAGSGHGGAFAYMSADTEVVAWILQRTSDTSLSEMVSQQLWSVIGAQDDAYYIVDPYGLNIGSVGLVATPLDLARLGQAVIDKGGRPDAVLSRSSIDVLHDGSARNAFAQSVQASIRSGYSYRNQWWVPGDADRSIEAKGLFGQHLVINPKHNVVIVKLSANPAGDTIQTHALDKAAFSAIVNAVSK